MRLALVVAALFRDTPGKPRGTLARPDQRALLAADKPLAAYFASVDAAGADGWAEERMRLVDRLKGLRPEERGDPQNVYAIAELMPTWRAWGQVLVDAGR
jgi:hypothetical protein